MQISMLFVDDEEMILRAIVRTLRHTGWDLHVASSAAEAIAFAERSRVDAVVSDYAMPQMSGVALLARMRVRHPRAMRLLMTGHADRAATIGAINDGRVCAYIEKPWINDEFIRVLSSVADEVREMRTAGAAPAAGASLRHFHEKLDVLHPSACDDTQERA